MMESVNMKFEVNGLNGVNVSMISLRWIPTTQMSSCGTLRKVDLFCLEHSSKYLLQLWVSAGQ